MTVPFIHKTHDNRRHLQQIERSPVIENKARAFLERGGRYLVEVLPDAKVHLMAILPLERDGVPGVEEVATITCENGPDLPIQIDSLISQSIDNSPPPQQSKIIAPARPGILV